jgi:hypothetical protein
MPVTTLCRNRRFQRFLAQRPARNPALASSAMNTRVCHFSRAQALVEWSELADELDIEVETSLPALVA